MKKILMLVLMIGLFLGCGDTIYNTEGLSVDPQVLLEYNVVLHWGDWGPVCGSAVVESTRDQTLIVTAGHCILTGEQMLVETNDGDLYPVELLDYELIDSDLALLGATKPIPIQQAAVVALQEPRPGEDAWTVGFGAREKDALSKGIVSKIFTKGHYGRTMNMYDVTVWYGNSGGGFYDSQGRLIGTVSQFGPQFDGHGPETGWAYGCTVKHIRRLLNGWQD
jgi:hypothetical protein